MSRVPSFVVDESCDFAVVRALREAGFSVSYRRLYVAAEGDRALERFLLESAAMQQRVAAEATEIFVDGFNLGTTSQWSNAVP